MQNRLNHKPFILFSFIVFIYGIFTFGLLAEVTRIPQIGDTYIFSAKNQGFYSGYYRLSATCQRVGSDFYIFTENVLVNDISISPTNPNQILIATTSGLYLSLDGGTSWQYASGSGSKIIGPDNNGVGFPDENIPLVHRAPVDAAFYMKEGEIWCGYRDGIYQSLDGGTTWSPKTRGLPNYQNPPEMVTVYPQFYKMVIDSRVTDFNANTDFYACSQAGLFYWHFSKFNDLGGGLPKTTGDWDHLSVFDFSNTGDTAVIATELGIFKGVINIDNKQASWLPLGGGTATVDSSVYDISNNTLKLYLNGVGQNTYVNIVDDAKSLYWSDKVSKEGAVMVAKINASNIYYSDVNVFDPSGLDYTTYDGRNAEIYIPSNENISRIYVSNDQVYYLNKRGLYTVSITAKAQLIHDFTANVYDLAINAGKMYVGTANGLFSSDLNDLSTWRKETGLIYAISTNGAQFDVDVRSIAISINGDIYLGCHTGGIMKKEASSGSLVNLNIGLGHRDLNLSKVDFISKVFDSLAVPATINFWFGDFPDIDNNGIMNILLMDIQDYYYLQAGDGQSFIDGCFNPIDQISPLENTNSNGTDIIYVDSDPLDLLSGEAHAAIAHYLTESILLTQENPNEQWVVKGISELAEFLCGLRANNMTYKIDTNNSLTLWGDYSEYKENEFSYLAFLYLYEHYFDSRPNENYNRSIKAMVEMSPNGIKGINACLSNAGYSEDFAEVFNDIAISAVLDQVEADDFYAGKYRWKNANVTFDQYILDWGFGTYTCPYYFSAKNWAFSVYMSVGQYAGYDWSPDLGDSLVFQANRDRSFIISNIFNVLTSADMNSYLVEMELDNKNWGWQDVSNFGDLVDPYQSLYTIVVQCSDSLGFGESEGNYIISNGFDDYYSNPWSSEYALRGNFRFDPLGVKLQWDDIYLGSEEKTVAKTPDEIEKMDTQSFKEYNYSKSVVTNPSGKRMKDLEGFEGFNVYRSDIIELENVQDFFETGDSTNHIFSDLPSSDIVYKGELDVIINSGFSSSNTFSRIYLDTKELGTLYFLSLSPGCGQCSSIYNLDEELLIEALENHEIVIRVINSENATPICDENTVKVILRLYCNQELISSLQSSNEYYDTDIYENLSYGYNVAAQFNGVESNLTNTAIVKIPCSMSTSILWTGVSNYGSYGDPNVPTGLSSMEWPGGSGIHYLWEGRFWVGAVVDGEKRVTHADYGNYEWQPSPSDGESVRPLPEIIPIGLNTLEHNTVFDDVDIYVHDTAPLNLKVIQHSKTWAYGSLDSSLANTLLLDQNVVNIGNTALNDVYVSWVFDCDIGTGYDPTSPNIDDLVDYEGWDGSDSDTDEEDIVENLDWNGNGILDGYDDNGIPYGWEYLGSPLVRNPNYNPDLITPDGYPDEYQVIITETDTVLASRMMSYMYDGDDPATPGDDTGEMGNVTGFIGLRLLFSPTGGVDSHQWWNWESDPGSDRDKYDYMAGVHPASYGHRYIPHPFKLGAPVFDYRFMLTTGPFFDFQPNDTLKFKAGVILGKGIRGIRQNSDDLALKVDKLDEMLPIIEEVPSKPIKYALHQNYPNPFNPVTTIRYELPNQENVHLTIYNTLGQKVRTLVNGQHSAGRYSVLWDGKDDAGRLVGSGLYFYQVQAGSFNKTAKMVFLK